MLVPNSGFYGDVWPANHNHRQLSSQGRSSNCSVINESIRPLTGLGSGESYESRFLRKCIDGGHAGIGHRYRAVGNQDFLQRVNRQEACVEQETSGQEEVRDNGMTSAAAEAFCSNCRRGCRAFVLSNASEFGSRF